MAHLSSRGYTPDDALAFRRRSVESHTIQWKASSYRWSGGTEHLLFDDIPLIGGELTLDSSDPTRRRLTLDLGAAGELVPDFSGDALAPFGQVIKLWSRIDRADGTGWFPWLKQGEFPIITTTSEWPSLDQTVECQDYSGVVDEFLHTHKVGYSGKTIYNAVVTMVQAALPNKAFAVHATDATHHVKVEPHTVAEAGSGRWETATEICQARGFECFFSANGDLVIRGDLTDDDADSIPGVGPDIGTVSSPVAHIREGEGGNLVSVTTSVSREGAANAVMINLHETADQKARYKGRLVGTGRHRHRRRGRLVSGDKRVNVLVQALATGSIAYGDRFGRLPVVLDRNVHVIHDDIVAASKQRAKRLLMRRGGLIRTVDLDAVGLLWLEPDDRVEVTYQGIHEFHYVSSVTFDLTGEQPVRIKLRSLNVSDPG